MISISIDETIMIIIHLIIVNVPAEKKQFLDEAMVAAAEQSFIYAKSFLDNSQDLRNTLYVYMHALSFNCVIFFNSNYCYFFSSKTIREALNTALIHFEPSERDLRNQAIANYHQILNNWIFVKHMRRLNIGEYD